MTDEIQSESINMSTDSNEVTPSQSATKKSTSKRKSQHDGATAKDKRAPLTDLLFYDESRHPASILHELHPNIHADTYQFEIAEISSHQTRFRCSLAIKKGPDEFLTVFGIGRSKQIAKNMAAQRALMALYPTYRPPQDAILSEECDSFPRKRFVPTLPPSIDNDPSVLIDSIRKHLTIKSLAVKSPLQLFHELFIHNQRLNSCTMTKNRVETIDNEENLIVVRATAMDQQFWSVSAAKHVAFNEACQQAIETICRVSFREARTQFIRALKEMNKLQIPNETITVDSNNNDVAEPSNTDLEKQSTVVEDMTTELTSLSGVSANFLHPNDES